MATTTTQQPPAPTAPVIPAAAPVAQPNLAPARPQVSASLYIGDLDPEIGESALYDLFKDIGNVASIRVCRDAISRASLGYAYVNFHNSESAERAIALLNGALLNKRPCRIMWSRRDPSIRKSGIGNIFIKNLHPDIDHANLLDLFSVFGNIHSCKLVTHKNGSSKGYGFVHFHTKESADKAIAKMNNLKLNGKEVYVAPFVPKRERPQKNPEDIFTNVFIKNIAETVTPKEFEEYFGKFGTITSAVLRMNDSDPPQNKGFGFVNYSSHEEAVHCVKETNDTEWNGKKLYSARAQSKAERSEQLKKRREEQASKYQGVNLYIKNLDDSVTEEKLRKAFEEHGTITSVKIMTSEKGVSKGFGFVCFSSPKEATQALTNMNNAMLENKPLYVALAQRKEVRRQQLEIQHAQRNTLARMQSGPGQLALTPPMGFPPLFYNQVAQSQRPGQFLGYPQMTNQYRGGRPTGYPTNQIPGQQAVFAGVNPGAPRAGGRQGNPRPNNGGRGGAQSRPANPAQPYPGGRKNPGAGANANPPAKAPSSPNPVRNSEDDLRHNLTQELYRKIESAIPLDYQQGVAGLLVNNLNDKELQELVESPDLQQKAESALSILTSQA